VSDAQPPDVADRLAPQASEGNPDGDHTRTRGSLTTRHPILAPTALLAAASGEMVLWDIATGRALWRAAAPGSRITALVLLRTIIGWHFLYEGYYKLLVPGWSRSGLPLTAWSASGYLKAATGPLAGFFHSLASLHGHLFTLGGIEYTTAGAVDVLVPLGLVCAGLSLILGLFTQFGAWVAFFFLAMFYVAYIPTAGVPVPNAEGTYLIVNKTLVELAAVGILLVFRTGRMAGLDLLRGKGAMLD